MHKIAYIFPVLAAAGMLVYLEDYVNWWGYALAAAGSVLILWLSMRGVTRTKEYLSGYALRAVHHNAWTEQVITTETYTDSKGRTHTRTRVSYVHHPDEWFFPLNTGRSVEITESTYDHYAMRWRTPMEYINPYHANCVSGGGGQQYEWDGIYDNMATATYMGKYINYVKYSDSIFRHEKVSDEVAEEYGLVEYPDFRRRYLETNAILVSPKLEITLPEGVEEHFWRLNAYFGQSKQIHIFIILFDAAKGIDTALKQRAFWHGGNKNEFTVCLGIENGTDVKWCKAFSWCDAPDLESATETWFINNPVLDLEAYANWLYDNIHVWKRKEFADFKYLGVNLSPTAKWIVSILTIVLTAAIIYFSYAIYTGQI